MRLQWKYSLIINLSVLAILVTFYVLDDIKARTDLKSLHVQHVERGAIFKEIAEKKIRPGIEDIIAKRQAFYRDEIEGALRDLKQRLPEMRDVIDINVIRGLDAQIQASLVPKSKGTYINFTGADLVEINRVGVKVYDTPPLNGKYATALIIPYRAEFIGGTLPDEQITGFIQVIFEVPDIAKYIHDLRLIHLISVIVVSVLLVFIIDVTTTRLIMRPLERMMEIIKHAEAGNLESLPQSYSSGEIGRITLSLVRMLRQLKESHSKRIAALGQFAVGVAHEIRNPLNSIGMTAQYLKDLFSQKDVKPADIEEARELLEIVAYEMEQLKEISEQFLALNRSKELKLEPTSLNALLDRVLAEFTLTMEDAKVQVIKNYDENLPTLQLDAGLIRQTIFNFIQNSIQAMPKGGSIYITTELEKTIAGKRVALEIRDTGIGIPEEIQERIFDAYFTTKESEGGMGLGLAISHQIIMAHQGQVDMKSKVGMGTAFKIYFPMENET